MIEERILLTELDGAVQDRLEPVLRSFEEAWKSGRQPNIADYLSAEPNERAAMLVELTYVDLEYRVKAGEPARVESYLQAYPELGREREQFLGLVESEYRLRGRCEPNLTPVEFLKRFPEHRQELSERFGRETAVERDENSATRVEQPAEEVLADGLTVPNYEILGEQGRGSMGVVYKARQRALGRLVALKMILAGPHADPHQRERFRNEAQILARLRHPNIVQIYEVGEHDGRPFLALEFIDGGTLADRLAGTPLPPADAARLVQSLAQAVGAAHQLGVVHRDLKPANVLIADCGLGIADSQGQPDPQSAIRNPQSAIKITDFGLAKQLVEPGQTRSGAVVGTPSYMAPEQARGDTKHVGPAADIYALGAILYELLTGRPPFKGASAMETMLQVLADEPVPPSRLQPKLPRDLETICLKCLQKRPQKRYATAGALADDLERFLTSRPILARPTRWPERLGKWMRREPKAAALTGAIIAVTLIAFGLVTWQWHRAVANAEIAAAQRDKARQRLLLARTAVDKFYTQVSESPEMRARGVEELRTKLLATAADFYRQFTEEEEGNDPEIRAEQGRGLSRLGELYLSIGRGDDAERAFRQALAIFAELLNVQPNDREHLHDQAATRFMLGELFDANHRYPDAEQAFQGALNTYRKLTADHPQVPDYRLRQAGCHESLGAVYRSTGRNRQAEQAQQQALAMLRNLTRDHPGVPEYWNRLATCYGGLSILYANTGRPSEALQAREQSLAVCKKVAEDQPNDARYQSGLAVCRHNLGLLYSRAGRAKEAEDAYLQALAGFRDLAAKHPLVPGFRHVLASSYDNLGNLYRDRGRAKEAEDAYQQALTVYRKLIEDDRRVPTHRNSLAMTYNNLGSLYQAMGQSKKAEEAYRKGLGISGPLVAEHPEVIDFIATLGFLHGNLAELLEGSPELPRVLQTCDQAIANITAVLAKQPRYPAAQSSLRSARCIKARTLTKLGSHAEAAREYAQAIELATGDERMVVRINLACALARSGDHAAAAAEARKVEKGPSPNGATLYNLACAYALAAGAAGKEREQPSARYAGQALEFLHKAQAAGYFEETARRAHLKKDPDLDPLRERPDFKKLVADLERPAENAKP